MSGRRSFCALLQTARQTSASAAELPPALGHPLSVGARLIAITEQHAWKGYNRHISRPLGLIHIS
jgi:hypothetical protein